MKKVIGQYIIECANSAEEAAIKFYDESFSGYELYSSDDLMFWTNREYIPEIIVTELAIGLYQVIVYSGVFK